MTSSYPTTPDEKERERARQVERLTEDDAKALLDSLGLRELFRGRVVFELDGHADHGAAGTYLQIDAIPPYDFHKVTLHRDHAMVPGPPEDERATVAHEYGHYLSNVCGLRPAAFRAAQDAFCANQPLTSEQQRLLVDEERLAWRLGIEALRSLGLDCTAAEARVEDALRIWAGRAESCGKALPAVAR